MNLVATWMAAEGGAAEPTEPAAGTASALEVWLRERGAEDPAETARAMAEFEGSLAWQTGTVTLADGAVELRLADGERYAPPASASAILEAWGNPPGPAAGGLLLPADAHLFGPGSWAVLVRYSADGWVDDSEPIDSDALLAAMRTGESAGNARRRELGLAPVELVGWAEAPRYDPAAHVLYWATLVRAPDGVTLSYDVRVLGRRGVLSLAALADERELAAVKLRMQHVRARVAFAPGHAYADYQPGVDGRAVYGLAALVGGSAVAAKTGVLQGLLALVLASKKAVVAILVGATAASRAWLLRRRERDPR